MADKQAVTMHAEKTHFSKLTERVEAGEEVLIARGKVLVAKLVPLETRVPERKFGAMKGRTQVGPEFFEPLSKGELGPWG